MTVAFVRVGSFAEIPEGEMRAYDLPTGRIAVAHVESRVFAFSDECTHAGCSLSESINADQLRGEVLRLGRAASVAGRQQLSAPVEDGC